MPNQKRETEKYTVESSRKKRETQIRREPDSASRPALPFFLKSQIAIGSRVSLPWRSLKKSLFSFAGQKAVGGGGGERYLSTDLYLRHWYTYTYCTQLTVAQTDYYRITSTQSIADGTRYFSRILQHATKKDLGKIPPPPYMISEKDTKTTTVRLAGTG